MIGQVAAISFKVEVNGAGSTSRRHLGIPVRFRIKDWIVGGSIPQLLLSLVSGTD